MTDFIAYADGNNDLIDIGNIIGVPVEELVPIIKNLKFLIVFLSFSVRKSKDILHIRKLFLQKISIKMQFRHCNI